MSLVALFGIIPLYISLVCAHEVENDNRFLFCEPEAELSFKLSKKNHPDACDRIAFPNLYLRSNFWQLETCRPLKDCKTKDLKSLTFSKDLLRRIQHLKKGNPKRKLLLKVHVIVPNSGEDTMDWTDGLQVHRMLNISRDAGFDGVMVDHMAVKKLDLFLPDLIRAKQGIGWHDMEIDLRLSMDNKLNQSLIEDFDKHISYYTISCHDPTSETNNYLCTWDESDDHSLNDVISPYPMIDRKKLIIVFFPGMTTYQSRENFKEMNVTGSGVWFSRPESACSGILHLKDYDLDLSRKQKTEAVLQSPGKMMRYDDIKSLSIKANHSFSQGMVGVGVHVWFRNMWFESDPRVKKCRKINRYLLRGLKASIAGFQDIAEYYEAKERYALYDGSYPEHKPPKYSKHSAFIFT